MATKPKAPTSSGQKGLLDLFDRPLRIDVHVHQAPAPAPGADAAIAALTAAVHTVLSNTRKIMATLDDVIQDMSDEKTAIGGISTLIAGLKQQLADALAGTTLPPAVQAKVDAVFAAAEDNKAQLAAALTPAP